MLILSVSDNWVLGGADHAEVVQAGDHSIILCGASLLLVKYEHQRNGFLVVQIMLRLSKQERPDIPPLEELPGQPLPGIRDYICLMKVHCNCMSSKPLQVPEVQELPGCINWTATSGCLWVQRLSWLSVIEFVTTLRPGGDSPCKILYTISAGISHCCIEEHELCAQLE